MGLGDPARIFLKFMSILFNIWLRCSRYSSATYARLLSWIDPEKKTFEVGGAPVSLDYAKFLGCHFRLDFQFFCYASIVLQYWADIFRSMSLLLLVSIIFSQPNFNKKSLLHLVAIYLD